MKLRLYYVTPDGTMSESTPVRDDIHYHMWLQTVADVMPEVNFFFTTETTDLSNWEAS